jgi:putative membrane protein
MFGEGGWMASGSMGGGMWIFGILLIIGVVVLIKGLTGRTVDSPPAQRHETPLEILKARYARGEINEAEFQHRRSELEK